MLLQKEKEKKELHSISQFFHGKEKSLFTYNRIINIYPFILTAIDRFLNFFKKPFTWTPSFSQTLDS